MTVRPTQQDIVSLPAQVAGFPSDFRPEIRAARALPATWTPARDAELVAARANGVRWHDIASRLGVSLWSAIERGRKIGAPRPRVPPRPTPEDPARPPLPADHSRSWGALIAGTMLDGTPYPNPVFE